jgi:hypothetical protein
LGGNEVEESQILPFKVTHVLSIISRRQPVAFAESSTSFERLVLNIEDSYDADLLSILPEALAFLDKAASSGGFCYVHCQQGRSRSASVLIAWLMQRQKEQGLKPRLLDCFAAVASRRRISALNYGFFARLCDFEASLGNRQASLELIDFFLLQFLGNGGMWNFKPAPDIKELRCEYEVRPDEKDKYGCPPAPRTKCIRRILQGFVFVLQQLSESSPACRLALISL